jgi:hypothetical protein
MARPSAGERRVWSLIYGARFDVVAALDNALPHLTPGQLAQAIKTMASRLKSGGLFLASIRDYDLLLRRGQPFRSRFLRNPGNTKDRSPGLGLVRSSTIQAPPVHHDPGRSVEDPSLHF